MTVWIQADDFTLNEGGRLSGVKFWTGELVGYFQGTVTWQIYANSPQNKPGTLLYSGSSPTSHAATGLTVYGPFKEYVSDFEVPSIDLPAGTYWLGLHNGPLSNVGSQNVFWVSTLGGRGNPGQEQPLVPPLQYWDSHLCPNCTRQLPPDLAFQLSGVSAPRIVSMAVTNRIPRLGFTTSAGQSYRVEFKSNLSDPSWTTLSGSESVAGTGGVLEITDPGATAGPGAKRFYRVVLL